MSATGSLTMEELEMKQEVLIKKYNKINKQIDCLTTHIYELQSYCYWLECSSNEDAKNNNNNINTLYKYKIDRLREEIGTFNAFKLLLLTSASKKADEINEIQVEIYGVDVVMAAYDQQLQQGLEQLQTQEQEHQQQNVQLMM